MVIWASGSWYIVHVKLYFINIVNNIELSRRFFFQINFNII